MPSALQELNFHTATTFQSIIFTPRSLTTSFEAISPKPLCFTNRFYGRRKSTRVAYISINTIGENKCYLGQSENFFSSLLRSEAMLQTTTLRFTQTFVLQIILLCICNDVISLTFLTVSKNFEDTLSLSFNEILTIDSFQFHDGLILINKSVI